MWRGGRDTKVWKMNPGEVEETETKPDKEWGRMEDIRMGLLSQVDAKEYTGVNCQGPPSGETGAAPRFKRDLEALLHLAGDANPAVRRIRRRRQPGGTEDKEWSD
jgi:hypothetical protein